MSGQFISIEGIEGVGKSTQLKFIADYLQAHNISVVTTREPGGTPLAEAIRALLLQPREEKVATDTELLLMFASRAQHIAEVIKPALADGRWVISDRFIDATYAYQGGGRHVALERINQLAKWTLNNFQPQLTILLDMPVELGLERAKSRNQAADRFESEHTPFFTAVREAYLQRARWEPQRIQVVNAARSIEEVQHDIQKILNKHLKTLA